MEDGSRTMGSASLVLPKVSELELPEEFRRRFTLGPMLGAGAFGQVFRARDASTGKDVAIKFLVRLDDEAMRARFAREIVLQKTVTHPNVVALIEASAAGAHPYLVTELVTGGSLDVLMDKEPRMAVERAVPLVAGCLAALAACHEKGLVHRDVKPANVLLTADGQPKLADLGLARALDDELSLTQTGSLVGTPAYLAPEMIVGEPLTPAVDVYAIAVMLFRMLTGRPPHKAESVVALLRMHVQVEPPSVRELVPEVPAGVADAVHAGLAKKADDRPTAVVLRRMLLAAVEPKRKVTRKQVVSSASSGAEPRRRRGLLVGGVLVLGVALAGVASWPRESRIVVATPSPTPAPGESRGLTEAQRNELARLVAEAARMPASYGRLDPLVVSGQLKEAVAILDELCPTLEKLLGEVGVLHDALFRGREESIGVEGLHAVVRLREVAWGFGRRLYAAERRRAQYKRAIAKGEDTTFDLAELTPKVLKEAGVDDLAPLRRHLELVPVALERALAAGPPDCEVVARIEGLHDSAVELRHIPTSQAAARAAAAYERELETALVGGEAGDARALVKRAALAAWRAGIAKTNRSAVHVDAWRSAAAALSAALAPDAAACLTRVVARIEAATRSTPASPRPTPRD
jgi:hypothetical protein